MNPNTPLTFIEAVDAVVQATVPAVYHTSKFGKEYKLSVLEIMGSPVALITSDGGILPVTMPGPNLYLGDWYIEPIRKNVEVSESTRKF
jgi:hypothetical protein